MKKRWNLDGNLLNINEEEIKKALNKELDILNENNIARIVMKHQGKFFQIPQLWQLSA